MKITPDQVRAARDLLHLGQCELAERANVSIVTIRRLETQPGGERIAPATLARMRAVLEEAGAEFIADGTCRRPAGRRDAGARFEKLGIISLASAARLRDRQLLAEADLYDENGLPR